ncbi:hypothetical protein E8E11_008437 [Didymella keratinophila]|nr:hypothetical protein E8E11_008437 [Didymella keratinophila]
MADLLFQDGFRKSCIETLASELTLLQQARQLLGSLGPRQIDNASTDDERVVISEPRGERIAEVETAQDVGQEVIERSESQAQEGIEHIEDVKYTAEELDFSDAGPSPTKFDLKLGACVDSADCEPYEQPDPDELPRVPNTNAVSYRSDGKSYYNCGGNVDWTNKMTALTNVDRSPPPKQWYITANGNKIHRWATPSRTRSRTLLPCQTLPANCSFDMAKLTGPQGWAPAWSCVRSSSGHNGATPTLGSNCITCLGCKYGRHVGATIVHDFLIPQDYLKRDDLPGGLGENCRKRKLGANNGKNGTDGLTSFNNPETVIDFAWRSLHTSANAGKSLARKLYGKAHFKSYYLGCSFGGRQGLKTKDGIIEDPTLCKFDPSTLRSTGNSTTNCLNDPQVEQLKTIFSDYKFPDGQSIYPAMQLGSEIGAVDRLYADAPFAYSADWFKYVVYANLTWDPSTFNYSDARAAETLNPGDIRTYPTNLPAFERRGGKMLTYHGQQDNKVTSFNTIRWYNNLKGRRSTLAMDEWIRFFRVSGMNH